MEVGISPSVSFADSSLIRGSLGSLEVGVAYGSRGMRVLRLAALAQDDRGDLRAFPVLHVILSKPKARRRIRYLLGKSAGGSRASPTG